jgi:hypothetical protein
MHFGPQPIHGVVRTWNHRWEFLQLTSARSENGR